MPQAVIAGGCTVAGQVAEVRVSLAAVVPWLWLTKRVKLAELPQTELAWTKLAQAEPVRTELVQTELARTVARAGPVRTELVRTELV